MKLLRSCLAVWLVLTAAGFVQAEKPKITRDVVYGHKDGLAMTLDVVSPEKPNGAGVMLMVSGGWFSRWYPPERVIRESPPQKNGFESLVDAGFTLFLVRHGSAPRYKVPDAVSDVRRAARFVRQSARRFGVDPDRLGAFGGSAGGHLSLVLGTMSDAGNPRSTDPLAKTGNRVAAVVAYFPPTDLRDYVGPSERFPALEFDPKLAESVSPLLHVSADDAPTLLIHGDKDKLVPLSQSQRIVEKFKEQKVEHKLLVIEGAAHGFRGDHQQQATQAMVAWFEKHLAKKPAE